MYQYPWYMGTLYSKYNTESSFFFFFFFFFFFNFFYERKEVSFSNRKIRHPSSRPTSAIC
jgi:hypothetical protein